MKKSVREKKPSSKIKVGPGGHEAFILSEPAHFGELLGFLAEGVSRRELCAVLAYSGFNDRIAAQLRDLHGVEKRALANGVVTFLSGGEDLEEIESELKGLFSKARRMSKPGRLLVNLGWGEAGWPDENELLRLDTRLNRLCKSQNVATLCAYDARQLSGQIMLTGAFQCHSTIYCRNTAHRNPLFVEPAVLQRELRGRRADVSRLEAWLS